METNQIMKHTPGPWTKTWSTARASFDIHVGDHLIASVYDDDGDNARLIAAAPELLEACLLAAVRLEGGTKEEISFNASVARILRAAIARAEGGK